MITNAYAYRGDFSSDEGFAGVLAYWKAFCWQIVIAVALSAVVLKKWILVAWLGNDLSVSQLDTFAASAGALTISVIPSLLGFGIGVYALTFAIPSKLVRDLDKLLTDAVKVGKRKHGSMLVLNVDLGYPLVVLAMTLGVGVMQQAFPSVRPLVCLCWLAFWYSIISLIEIVGVLFRLGEVALLEKRSENSG
ncbi:MULTISPECIES: hypothetical protein [Pandoraea]|uniref:hypothetical protein n=1 Tax=Pandoraea TaxID=93217 RepID=UPI001F5D31FD|nr:MULTISPECIES: hypothetical protein [Pandoraea]